jgi:hypothetical protein
MKFAFDVIYPALGCRLRARLHAYSSFRDVPAQFPSSIRNEAESGYRFFFPKGAKGHSQAPEKSYSYVLGLPQPGPNLPA